MDMLRQILAVMKRLREMNKSINDAQKINEWVDSYLEECALTNQPVTIITPWSLSRSFKQRHVDQGDAFSPTHGEVRLFKKEIPAVSSILQENGLRFSWWLVFSRSYIRAAAISPTMETEYVSMITDLVETYQQDIVVVNWEDDVLHGNHKPNADLLEEENFRIRVNKHDFEYELARRRERSKSTLGLVVEDNDLVRETKFKIACEAEEGLFLMENGNPICEPGKFVFMILSRAERYSFFSTLVPKFERRIVCVLKPYPWRI